MTNKLGARNFVSILVYSGVYMDFMYGSKTKNASNLTVLYLLKYFLFKCYNNVYYKIYYNLGNIHSVGKEIHNIGPGFLRDRGGGVIY